MTKGKGAALDISALGEAVKRQNEGIEVSILGMDGKPTGLKIRVAGPDSRRALEAQEELTDARIEKLAAQVAAGGSPEKLKASDATKQGINYLARITLGWTPANINDGEEEFAFSHAAAVRLYTKYRYIRDQVDRVAADRTRFTKG